MAQAHADRFRMPFSRCWDCYLVVKAQLYQRAAVSQSGDAPDTAAGKAAENQLAAGANATARPAESKAAGTAPTKTSLLSAGVLAVVPDAAPGDRAPAVVEGGCEPARPGYCA